jgi:hypothetical protein
MGGRGGELDWTCTVRIEERYCGPAWVAEVSFPVKKFKKTWGHHSYSVAIPEGGQHETRLAAIQPSVGALAKDHLSAFSDSVLDTKDALLSSVNLDVYSNPGGDGPTVRSEVDIKRTTLEVCEFEFDLDGVTRWTNQSVAHGKCNGSFNLNHTSDDYSLEWEGGQVNASGSIDDVSVQFKNDSYREGDTTYREATLDGHQDYEEPNLMYRDGDREYALPECFWEGDC